MSEKKVLIFGTGQFAQIIKRYLEEQGRVLAGFTVTWSREYDVHDLFLYQ